MPRNARVRLIPLVALCALTAGLPARAEPVVRPSYDGELYALASKRQQLLFRVRIAETEDGQFRRNTFTNPRGTLVAREEVEMKDNRLVSYSVEHPLAKRNATVRRKGSEVTFTYTEDGETRTQRERVSGLVAAGPMIMPLVREHWDRIAAGETLEIQLVVVHRLTTYGFTIRRTGTRRVRGGEAVLLTMQPSNILLNALVDPLVFALRPDGEEVLEIRGRVTPLSRDGGSWAFTDADTVYRKLPRD